MKLCDATDGVLKLRNDLKGRSMPYPRSRGNNLPCIASSSGMRFTYIFLVCARQVGEVNRAEADASKVRQVLIENNE